MIGRFNERFRKWIDGYENWRTEGYYFHTVQDRLLSQISFASQSEMSRVQSERSRESGRSWAKVDFPSLRPSTLNPWDRPLSYFGNVHFRRPSSFSPFGRFTLAQDRPVSSLWTAYFGLDPSEMMSLFKTATSPLKQKNIDNIIHIWYIKSRFQVNFITRPKKITT